MTWLKTDDGEGMAPWVLEIGNEAYGVYQRLGSYCAEHLTDGFIPARIAMMIAERIDPLLALEIVGRAERDELGNVRLPRFLDSNPTRQEHEAKLEERSERGRKAAAARWGNEAGGRRRSR